MRIRQMMVILVAAVATAWAAADGPESSLHGRGRKRDVTVATMPPGRAWRADVPVAYARVGRPWAARPVVAPARLASRQDGYQSNRLATDPLYLQSLAAPAAAGHWRTLRTRLTALGIDASVLSSETPGAVAAPPLDGACGGYIDPAGGDLSVAQQIEQLGFLGFDRPIVLVRRLGADWPVVYDRAIAAVRRRCKAPILAVCVARMPVEDMLRLPAFAGRYAETSSAFVANIDLTNGNFVYIKRGDKKAMVREASDRVAVASALLRLGAPKAQVFLAVGYHRVPAWTDWIAAQHASTFTGVLLTGDAASHACSHPVGARSVLKKTSQAAEGKAVAIGGYRHRIQPARQRDHDDYLLEAHKTVRAMLAKEGVAFTHIAGY